MAVIELNFLIPSVQEPQEVVFGDPYYSCRFLGSKREKVLKADKFYHVPLLKTLKQVLTHSDVQYELNNPREHNDYLQDFVMDHCISLIPFSALMLMD